jgi:hypothetical protein
MATYRLDLETDPRDPASTTRAEYYAAHRLARTIARSPDYAEDVASIGLSRARIIFASCGNGLVTRNWGHPDTDPDVDAIADLWAETIREQIAARAALSWTHRSKRDNDRARRYLCRARRLRLDHEIYGHRLP